MGEAKNYQIQLQSNEIWIKRVRLLRLGKSRIYSTLTQRKLGNPSIDGNFFCQAIKIMNNVPTETWTNKVSGSKNGREGKKTKKKKGPKRERKKNASIKKKKTVEKVRKSPQKK